MRRDKNKPIPKESEISTGIPIPQIDPELSNLPVRERITETIRYTLKRLEYTISPSGSIRRWGIYWLKVGVGIAVPALILLPIILLAAGAVLSLTETLIQTIWNVGFILLPLGLIGMAVYGLMRTFKK